MNRLGKTDSILLVSFLALLIFPLPYMLRHLDDNTLTSWRWVFADGRMLKIFGIIALGIIAAFFMARTTFPDRNPPLFLFLLSFLTVVPLWQEPEAILDASRYFLQAKHLELYGIRHFFLEWGGAIGVWTDLPVVPFFYGIIFKHLGEVRIFIQVFNTALFSFTIVLTYLIGRILWNKETGLCAGLLLLGIPYLLTQVPLMLVDVPTMFLVTLSLYTFLNAVQTGGIPRIALSSVAIFLALFTKYSTWPMLLILPVISFISMKQSSFMAAQRIILRRSIAVLATAGISAVAVLLAKYDVFTDQLNILRTYQWPGLDRWKESFASTFLFQVHPFISISALLGVFAAIRKRDVRFLIPGWFAVFVLALQVERIRYLLPLFPLLALMAAYGLNELKYPEVKRFVALCAVTASLALILGAYLPFLNKSTMANLRDAGRYLDTLPGEAVVIHALQQKESAGNTEMAIPILDLFTRKRLIYPQERTLHPAGGKIKESPLRFSWEFRPPQFYSEDTTADNYSVAVISSESENPPQSPFSKGGTIFTLPFHSSPIVGEGARRREISSPPFAKGSVGGFSLKTFASGTGAFRYKTFVTVFSRTRLAETAQ